MKRRPSGEGPAEKLKRRYRALEHEKLKVPLVQNFNETQLTEYSTVAHQAWQLYTSQLNQTVMKLVWSENDRQQYWDVGYAAFMLCYRAITDRQAKLQTDKLQRKLDRMKAGAEKLIDIADNMPNGAQKKDFEKLIDDSNRQAEELKKLADETVDVEMLDLVADWNKKLVFTAEKLKKTYSQTDWSKRFRDTSGERPRPIFKTEKETSFKDTSFRTNDHWYSHQSPSVNDWAEEVEEEYPMGSFGGRRSNSRTRWADQQQEQEHRQEDGGDQSFIRGAYRDPFLHVLDKLANRMDRPARPAPPAWPVFTDKYQDYPKWRKDVTSYLKDYCGSLKNETKVMHIKEKCFSKKTVALLDSFETLNAIFRRLEQIYKQPACYAVEAMRPFQNQKLKADTDCVGLELAYQKIVKVLRKLRNLISLIP